MTRLREETMELLASKCEKCGFPIWKHLDTELVWIDGEGYVIGKCPTQERSETTEG